MTKPKTTEILLERLQTGNPSAERRDLGLAFAATSSVSLLVLLLGGWLSAAGPSAWSWTEWLLGGLGVLCAQAVIIAVMRRSCRLSRHREIEDLEAIHQEMAEDLAIRRLVETALRERTQSVLLLQRIAVAANEAKDPDSAIQACLDAVCGITGWPIGHAFRVDPQSGSLNATRLWHVPSEEETRQIREVSERVRLAPGQGLPGRVLESTRSAWVTDVSQDSGISPRLAEAGIASAFAFPVMVGSDVVAVLEFFSPTTVEFDPTLLELTDYLGAQIGLVVERRRTQDILRDSERRYEILAQVLPVGIYRIDPQGHCVYANHRWCEITGMSRRETLGEGWIRAFRQEDFAAEGASTSLTPARVLATLRERQELRLNHPGGSPRWVLSQIDADRDPEGRVRGHVGTLTDITERKEEEEERRRLEAQVLQSQKLESLGLLAGGIAHDFNNLLMGILGNAGLAQMELPPTSPTRRLIQEIERAAQRAAELAHQMLAYSGKSTVRVGAVALSDIAEEMVHLLEAVIPKKAALTVDFTRGLPTIEGDATQIRQVVMNLITNASDALDAEGGEVMLRTSKITAEEGFFHDADLGKDAPPGLYVLLEVTDTGHGMNAGTVSKIFDPFFTTKTTGRGLGMATVLGVVRGHRGAINVESTPDRGTRFKVYFPASESSPSSLDSSTSGVRQAEAAAWSGEGTVLVVDDEEMVRRLAERILQRSGFTVLAAENGQVGLDLFDAHEDEIVAILLDMTMPVLDGAETLRGLRSRNQLIPVILSSGYSDQEAVHRLTEDKATEFIQKPYRPTALMAMLRMVLEG